MSLSKKSILTATDANFPVNIEERFQFQRFQFQRFQSINLNSPRSITVPDIQEAVNECPLENKGCGRSTCEQL